MQQALLLLLAGATTARTAALADAWEGAAADAGKSPVARVVKLLTDMHARLQQDTKEEADLEAKLTCFCENNDGAKSAAVEKAKADLDQLGAEIEARAAAGVQLTADIAAQEQDANKLGESFDAAEGQRAKEADANHKEILELTVNLETMKAAVMVLSRHNAVAFPQMSKAFLEEGERHGKKGNPDKDSNALDSWMAERGFGQLDASTVADVDRTVNKALRHSGPHKNAEGYTTGEMSTLSKAQVVMNNFLQSNSMEYAPFAGEVVGLLKQMQDQFAKELGDLEATDKQQEADFTEMKERLQQAITTSEKIVKQKEAKKADNAQARADAVETVDALRGQLSADEAFLVDLEKNCGNRAKDFAERKQTRALEMQAVSQAITILNGDDNRDLMGKTLGNTALVQAKRNETQPAVSLLQLGARRQRMSARARAVASLRAQKRPSVWLELAASRIEVSRDGFVRVRKAVDKMVAALNEQQKAEVEHKDWCKGTMHENEMNTATGERALSLLTAERETLTTTMQDLADHLAQTHADVKDLEVNMQRANQDRSKQNKEFQRTVDEQRATVIVIQRAIDKLAGFYDAQAAALVQGAKVAEAAKLKAALVQAHKPTPKAAEPVPDCDCVGKPDCGCQGGRKPTEAKAAEPVPDCDCVGKPDCGCQGGRKPTEAKAAEPDTRAALSSAIHNMAKEFKGLKAPVMIQSSHQKALDEEKARVRKLEMELKTAQRAVTSLEAPSFVQLAADPPSELAGGLGDYQKHAAGGSALTMLRGLVADSRELEAEATRNEQSANDGYVSFMADAHSSHAALGRAIVAATEQRAESEVAMAQLKEDRAAQATDLEELAAKLAAAHQACDFVLNNFDTRQVARQTEIDALKQAMAILLGAA